MGLPDVLIASRTIFHRECRHSGYKKDSSPENDDFKKSFRFSDNAFVNKIRMKIHRPDYFKNLDMTLM